MLEEMLVDFPFVSDADKANAYAFMLSFVLRPVIIDSHPLAAFAAPTEGTGKSKLVSVCVMAATGQYPAALAAPRSEDEWRKQITGKLLRSDPVFLIDNFPKDVTLRSESLAAALTTQTFQGRLLGGNETPELPVSCAFVVTGNNLKMSREISRRSYAILQDAGTAQPWLRRGFRHNLDEWVPAHRGELPGALLTFARAWHVAGRPHWIGPTLGGYENWCRVVGGVLQVAGVDGFLENIDEHRSRADDETAEWDRFIDEWASRFTRAVSVSELIAALRDDESFAAALPGDLAESLSGEGSLPHRLGNALSAREGARFGAEALRIRRSGERQRAQLWHIEP